MWGTVLVVVVSTGCVLLIVGMCSGVFALITTDDIRQMVEHKSGLSVEEVSWRHMMFKRHDRLSRASFILIPFGVLFLIVSALVTHT